MRNRLIVLVALILVGAGGTSLVLPGVAQSLVDRPYSLGKVAPVASGKRWSRPIECAYEWATGDNAEARIAYAKLDFELAATIFEKAADEGNAEAAVCIGEMYSMGRGVSRNYVFAAEYYRKAAEAGDVDGLYHLAQVYYRGRGVPPNYVIAADLYAKAAEQGHTNAMYDLGVMYARGEGVAKDIARSEELLRQASGKSIKQNGQEKEWCGEIFTSEGYFAPLPCSE